jgi:hypothetical protein
MKMDGVEPIKGENGDKLNLDIQVKSCAYIWPATNTVWVIDCYFYDEMANPAHPIETEYLFASLQISTISNFSILQCIRQALHPATI